MYLQEEQEKAKGIHRDSDSDSNSSTSAKQWVGQGSSWALTVGRSDFSLPEN